MAGLLDLFAQRDPNDPVNMGLLGMSAALGTPVRQGGGVGPAFGAFGQGYQGSQQAEMRRRLMEAQVEQMRIENELAKRPKERNPVSVTGGYIDSDGKFVRTQVDKETPVPFEYEQGPDGSWRMKPGVLAAKTEIAKAGAQGVPMPLTAVQTPDGPRYATPPTRGGGPAQVTDLVPVDSPARVKANEEKAKAVEMAKGAASKAERIVETIDTILPQINSATAGFMGKMSSKVPGSASYNLEMALNEIRANVGFQELSAMRKESKTGGALGQVAVKELEMLQATLGSLDIGQGEKQLKANLLKVKQHYENFKKAIDNGGGPSITGNFTDDMTNVAATISRITDPQLREEAMQAWQEQMARTRKQPQAEPAAPSGRRMMTPTQW